MTATCTTAEEIRMELSSIVIAIRQLRPDQYLERARFRSRQHELKAEVGRRRLESAA